MKKRDVGIANRFSKKYRNKGWAINYVQSESYVKMPVNAWCYIPTSLPREQALKTNNYGFSGKDPSIQYYAQLGRVWLILAYDWPCLHEAGKAHTCWIERRWHIYT